jgi:hypothetical protein
MARPVQLNEAGMWHSYSPGYIFNDRWPTLPSLSLAKNPNKPSNARLAPKQTQTNPVEPIPRTAWQRSWELFHSKASRLVHLDFILP